MKTYVDANALVQLYLHLPGEVAAMTFLSSAPASQVLPCPITDLLRFEVANAIERMVFESRHGSSQRVTPESAMLAEGDFEADLSGGVRLRRVPLNLSDIEANFCTLVRHHTATHGFRTYDVMHVCSALKLRCKRFLSFDAQANALAKLVGLKTL